MKLFGIKVLLRMSPCWSLCTLYLSKARWSYRRRLGSLLLCACSMSDVNCSSAIASHCVLAVCYYLNLLKWPGAFSRCLLVHYWISLVSLNFNQFIVFKSQLKLQWMFACVQLQTRQQSVWITAGEGGGAVARWLARLGILIRRPWVRSPGRTGWDTEISVPPSQLVCRFVCTARTQMCAHVKDPISISRKRLGLTAGSMETRKHCTQGRKQAGLLRPRIYYPRKTAQFVHALHWDKKVSKVI